MRTPAWFRGLAIVAYAFGASAAFDGPELLVALGLGTATVALMANRQPSPELPRFRLEHRHPGRVRVLAATHDEATGRTTLQEQTATLTASGASGQLVLVDVASGRAVTWQVLAPRIPAPSQAGAGEEGVPS
jgi:hypothetical protein